MCARFLHVYKYKHHMDSMPMEKRVLDLLDPEIQKVAFAI